MEVRKNVKNIFGEPKKGVHKYRVANLAIFDVFGTVVGAWIISYAFGFKFWIVLGALFLLGIILHWIFGVDTTVQLWIKRTFGL